MHSSGRIWFASLFALLLAVVSTGCDSTEDPALLNPPPPDSTRVRVVNLVDEAVTVVVAGVPVATDLPTFAVSNYRNFLDATQVPVIVRRSRNDTLPRQDLRRGTQVTYFITGTGDTTVVVPRETSAFTEEDLRVRRMARVVFINALPDTTATIVKIGCEGGDTLFIPTRLGGNLSKELEPVEASLYLTYQNGGAPLATARTTFNAGETYYLVAANVGGRPGLFVLAPNATSLAPLPAETRSQAAVQILNAFPEGNVEASLGATRISDGVLPLTLSNLVDVSACSADGSDTLEVTPPDGTLVNAPVRFGVGSRSTVVVYGTPDGVRTITLRRDNPPGQSGKVYLRAINLVSTLPAASIEAGAGAPDSVQPEKRLFGLLQLGAVTPYLELPQGEYPLIVKDAATGTFLGGGVGSLTPGHYTLLIVARSGGEIALMLMPDAGSATELTTFGERGAQVRLFNMMPDADAEFSAGGLTLPAIPYSYVRSTLFPAGLITVTSNAGQTTVDLTSASYTIGATGSGSNRSLVTIPSLTATPPPGMASVRFFNAVPGSGELVIHSGSNTGEELARTTFGNASAVVNLDERKYAFAVTSPTDTTTLARADGLELTEGRRYLFIIGPRRSSGSGAAYEVLWMQD